MRQSFSLVVDAVGGRLSTSSGRLAQINPASVHSTAFDFLPVLRRIDGFRPANQIKNLAPGTGGGAVRFCKESIHGDLELSD